MLKLCEKTVDIMNRVLMTIGGVALLCLMLVAAGNVLLRVIGYPVHGAVEIEGFLGAILIAFALSESQKKGDHIMVEIFNKKFPPALLLAIESFKLIVCIGFFAIVAWQVYLWGARVKESGELSETLKIAYYPIVFCVAIGFVALVIQLVLQAVLTVARKETHR